MDIAPPTATAENTALADLARNPASTQAAGTLRLAGSLLRPATLTLDALRRYPGTLGAPFDLRCYTTGRFIRTVPPYRGVRLTALLEEAGLRCDEPGDFKRMVFFAVGHDGYFVTFSWHELFNTPVGEQVLVAYECGGAPLDAETGAPVLYSGTDLVPAPRHVKRLVRIEARVLAL
ncbi:molybdopterin-dependent oxidoreductase [Paraburkholderia acidisoli]|uniref:Molybdopterin-dependent oxidoreductase n=1 Tax=Paraburkholderia acidisoli TaxID=2571748 RepID=A0A7Z2GNU7_9BURK|nr:molybdopterin-dependent oxidoreductase [Paraburkholderia acidisoli]QGZ65220.1 molybdopterin-dependent oxidoreductase [Paraburkholderia acidisoli]